MIGVERMRSKERCDRAAPKLIPSSGDFTELHDELDPLGGLISHIRSSEGDSIEVGEWQRRIEWLRGEKRRERRCSTILSLRTARPELRVVQQIEGELIVVLRRIEDVPLERPHRSDRSTSRHDRQIIIFPPLPDESPHRSDRRIRRYERTRSTSGQEMRDSVLVLRAIVFVLSDELDVRGEDLIDGSIRELSWGDESCRARGGFRKSLRLDVMLLSIRRISSAKGRRHRDDVQTRK